MAQSMGLSRALPLSRRARACVLWCAWAVFGSAASAQVATAPKREVPLVPTNCTDQCHKPIITHTVMHKPGAADCAACHIQVGEFKDHKFAFKAAREELCLKCHQLTAETHPHKPVAEGKCMDCHDPHGSEHKAQLIADPKRDLCIKCHENTYAKKQFVHGPVAVGACTACHKWHSSNVPKLLSDDSNALCVKCHAETLQVGPGVHMHKALEKGCVNCHDPHASDFKFQLAGTSPGICMSCHKEQFDKMTSAASGGAGGVVHAAITEPGGCTTCHEAHTSKLPNLQKGLQVETCLKCHDKPVKASDGSMLADMGKLLANNPQKHGPIRDGHCTVCHDPHAAKNFRLLPAEYPQKFYSPFSMDLYKLCFQCHSPDLVLKQNGQGVTQFRDGIKNLHALHVNQEKGRTCRACHEVHASSRPAHVREAVPFGSSAWMREINYQPSEEGGSCAPGCHAPKKYTRPRASVPAPRETIEPVKPAAPKPEPVGPTPVAGAGAVSPAQGAPVSPTPGVPAVPSTSPTAAPSKEPSP